MDKYSTPIPIKFRESTKKQMDALIKKKEFDSYSQLIRKAVNTFLKKYEEETIP